MAKKNRHTHTRYSNLRDAFQCMQMVWWRKFKKIIVQKGEILIQVQRDIVVFEPKNSDTDRIESQTTKTDTHDIKRTLEFIPI